MINPILPAATPVRSTSFALAFAALFLAACGGDAGDSGSDGAGELSGQVIVDGSSTVFPVSEAVAEEFQMEHPGARVTVGQSGTGGGFKRFCAGEIQISDASRPITGSEIEECEQAGVEYVEVPVAWDGLSVVANPANDFADCLTMDELQRIWRPGSDVETWRDVRSHWPASGLSLYGPGTDSGTFDYFTEEVMGESGASRADFQASEDDNVLVQGVAGDEEALGYFGYAYFAENRDRLKLLGVDRGEGCVEPSDASIEEGTYPLARPIFIYVSRSALADPTVAAFVRYYMENAPELVPATGYHALDAARYRQNLDELFGAGDAAGAAGSDATSAVDGTTGAGSEAREEA